MQMTDKLRDPIGYTWVKGELPKDSESLQIGIEQVVLAVPGLILCV